DQDTQSWSQTVPVVVTPVSDAPDMGPLPNVVAVENSDAVALMLPMPTDADGDTVSITVTGLPSNGTVTLTDGSSVINGQILTAAQFAGLKFAAGSVAADTASTFEFSLTDGTASSNHVVSIEVQPQVV